MTFDLKGALASFAPTLATMLGGPLAGAAVASLEAAMGLAPGAGVDAVSKALQDGKLTSDQIAAIQVADMRHKEVMGQQGIDLEKLHKDFEQAQTAAVIDDRKDARKQNSDRDAVWWIAVVILATFAVMMGAVLYGCWIILQGGISIKDVSVVAAISGLIGSVVGYVAANAQTVVNFIYGGSLGSEKKTDALSASVQQAISTVSK